jgi:putative transcriptional regulator
VRYFHFAAGRAAVGKEAGCLVLSPGARFPRHSHDGPERSMVLEGTLLLDGRAWHAGSVVECAAGTSHDFAAGAGRDLVVIVIHDGISFGA